MLEAAVGAHIPRGEEGRGWEVTLPVPGREGLSFQHWVVRQPIKMGGMGFRSLEETSLVAFLGTLEQTVPSFSGPEGGCPQLAEILGGEECFGEEVAGGELPG